MAPRSRLLLALLLLVLRPGCPASGPQDTGLPPFRLLWPQEGERVRAGWVELLYAVQPPRGRSLAFAVLLDGEIARHHGAGSSGAAHGRIPVWIDGAGRRRTLTLELHYAHYGGVVVEGGGGDGTPPAATGRVCLDSGAGKCVRNGDGGGGGRGDGVLSSEWSHGAASVTLLVVRARALGMFVMSPFPRQVAPPAACARVPRGDMLMLELETFAVTLFRRLVLEYCMLSKTGNCHNTVCIL